MTKTKKLLALLMAAVMVLGLLPAVALADEEVFYTLDGTITGSNQNYANEGTITQNSMTWIVTGNVSMNPWRIGGKNLSSATDRPVYSTKAMGNAISKVELELGTINITANSLQFIVASDDAFTNVIDQQTITSISADSTITFTPTAGTEWATGAYYKFVFNVTNSTSSNKYIQFKSAKFYKNVSGDDPQPQTYTVTFDYNDGGLTANTTATTGTDGKLTSLPEPTWTDHNFLGWFTAATGGDQITTGTVFTADTTVYAHWEETPAGDTYTYQLVTDVYALEAGNKLLIVSEGEAGSGYALSRNKGNNRGAASVAIDSNLKIETEIAASNDDTTKPFELTLGGSTGSWTLYDSVNSGYLYAAGGTGSNYLKVVAEEQLVDTGKWTIEIASSNGATIKAIDTNTTRNCIRYNNSNLLFSCYSSGQEAVYIYKLVENGEQPVTNYTVSFNANGGSGEMASVTKAENTVYTLPANGFTAPEGYRFTGWKVGNAGDLLVAETDSITITGNVELFAQWEEIPAPQTTDMRLKRVPANGNTVVIYYPTAGKVMTAKDFLYNNKKHELVSIDATLTDNVLAVPDEAVRLIVSVADGKYTFATADGKYLEADGTNVQFVSEQGANTLFQLETAAAGTDNYYIKCDSANYNGAAQYIEYFNGYFTVYSLNTSNTGIYTFQFFSEDGEGPTPVVTYNVSFDANGGSGTMDPVTTTSANYTLPACGFTAPEGFVFAGWTIQDGNGEIYAAGAQVELTGDTTFVAQWTNNTKTYQLVTNEGQLAAGGKYIMVGVDSDNAARALAEPRYNETSVPYYRKLVGVTINNGKIELPQSQIATSASDNKVFELTLGGSAADGWTFHDGFNGYLCATGEGTDQNYMGFQTEVTADGKFVVAIGTDGMVRATAKSDRISRQIRYNSDVQRFSCYKTNSHTKFFYLYKLVDPAPDGYYLIGPDWTVGDVDLMKQFTPNPGSNGEYMLYTKLTEGQQIKVVHITNGVIDAWYPDGMDNQYTVDATHAGDVTIYFKTDYVDAWAAFGGYFYIADRDFFKTQNLILSGQIGVQFFVDLSGLEPEEKAAAKVSFEITGKGKDLIDKGPLALDENNHNANWYYGFACKVNAIQMADTITATLNIGETAIATKEYSVQQYVEAWDTAVTNGTTGINDETLRDKTTALIHALADYGHYVQLFLKEVNHWTLGTDYAAMMEDPYTGSYTVSTVQSAVAEYQMTAETTGAFKAPSMSLVLDSETAIRIFLAHEDGSMLDVNSVAVNVMPDNEDVAWDAETQLVKTQKGNRVMVEIKGIKAAWLAETFTITAEEGDNAQTINVSALSYVGRLLASEAYADNAAAQNAVCALYYYAMAAKAYNE
jgi:uncharacterized repeat protein (TIGR02543 family)